MKKIYIFFLGIAFLSGCDHFYHFAFEKKSESEENTKLSYWAIEALCFEITFSENIRNRIRDIEYIDGWLKIGNETVTFAREEILISLVLRGHSRFSSIGLERNGKILISEEEKQEYFKHMHGMRFFRHLDRATHRMLYAQDGEIVRTFFEFRIILDDNVIHYRIEEEYVMNAERVQKIVALIGFFFYHL